jgi:hypothetical protein
MGCVTPYRKAIDLLSLKKKRMKFNEEGNVLDN